MTDDRQVWIFYSSRTEPELLDFYSEGIEYLKASDVDAKIIDVEEDAETAREHDITATPVLMTRHEGELQKHFGIVSGLRNVLEEDLYGRSILHKMGFKEGRDAAEGVEPENEAVEDMLESFLADHEVRDVEVSMDVERHSAAVSFTVEGENPEHVADDIRPFLGGTFTELFGTGVRAVVKDVDDDEYHYTVSSPQEERTDLLKTLLDRLRP